MLQCPSAKANPKVHCAKQLRDFNSGSDRPRGAPSPHFDVPEPHSPDPAPRALRLERSRERFSRLDARLHNHSTSRRGPARAPALRNRSNFDFPIPPNGLPVRAFHSVPRRAPAPLPRHKTCRAPQFLVPGRPPLHCRQTACLSADTSISRKAHFSGIETCPRIPIDEALQPFIGHITASRRCFSALNEAQCLTRTQGRITFEKKCVQARARVRRFRSDSIFRSWRNSENPSNTNRFKSGPPWSLYNACTERMKGQVTGRPGGTGFRHLTSVLVGGT